MLRGSEGDHTPTGALTVRQERELPSEKTGGVVGLLVELFGTTYDGGVFDDKKNPAGVLGGASLQGLVEGTCDPMVEE